MNARSDREMEQMRRCRKEEREIKSHGDVLDWPDGASNEGIDQWLANDAGCCNYAARIHGRISTANHAGNNKAAAHRRRASRLVCLTYSKGQSIHNNGGIVN